MSDETHVYKTSLAWTSQRMGTLHSPGLPDVVVATPPQFPGGHEGIWSPEHLFVASAEVCLMTTFLAIAANSKLEFATYSSEATGKNLGRLPDHRDHNPPARDHCGYFCRRSDQADHRKGRKTLSHIELDAVDDQGDPRSLGFRLRERSGGKRSRPGESSQTASAPATPSPSVQLR